MKQLQVEEEKEKLREYYGKCILVINEDGSVVIVEPDGKVHPWDSESSFRYRSYFNNTPAKEIFREARVKK